MSVFLSILQNCKIHSIILSLFWHYICIICIKDTTKSTEMVTLTEKGCPGINAAADLLWSVKLLTRIVGKSSLTKKTSHYI